MKKVITIIIILNIIINICLLYKPIKTYENKLSIKNDKLKNITINVLDKYKENEVYTTINNKKEKTTLNTSSFKNYKPGTYYVNYKVKINEYLTVDNLQKVTVKDNIKPVINIKDETIILNDTYYENKVYASDNIDGDISNKVKITGTVDTKKLGEYKITYKVKDSSNNETTKEKIVKVVKEEIETEKPWYLEFDNTIINMKYIENKIYLEFYLKQKINKINVKLDNKIFSTEKLTNNIYSTLIDIKNLKNGTYTIKLETDKPFNLKSNLEEKYRLIRTKIKDKLVTFIYNKTNVQIKIENFSYKYDILIDPGHGGFDIGASVNGITEAEINLKQSLYEKKRYEDHGLKVFIIREDDTYGTEYGSKDLPSITRRAFAVGYHGVLSKIVYSNHQNSNSNKTMNGWEILVPCTLTYEDLLIQHKIANDFNKIYNIKDTKKRMYSRDYHTDIIYNKINGEVHNFVDYYAVNREPLQKCNVISPIYEHTYMSNEENFNWYVTKENYKKMSEIKIKHYVESLGIKYKGVDNEK